MTRSVIAFSSAVLLGAFSPLLAAQTETVINARGEERTAPYHAQGAGWSATVDRDTLQAVLTIDERSLRGGEEAVDYELVVTNTGSKAVKIPRALEWKDVDSGGSEQRYLEAKVVFELSAKNVSTPVTPTLNLYSVDEKPLSQLVLAPGDSIRILGSTSLPATAFSPNWSGKAILTAHFCVSSIRVISTGSPRKTTQLEHQMLWCVSANPKYEVPFDPKQ